MSNTEVKQNPVKDKKEAANERFRSSMSTREKKECKERNLKLWKERESVARFNGNAWNLLCKHVSKNPKKTLHVSRLWHDGQEVEIKCEPVCRADTKGMKWSRFVDFWAHLSPDCPLMLYKDDDHAPIKDCKLAGGSWLHLRLQAWATTCSCRYGDGDGRFHTFQPWQTTVNLLGYSVKANKAEEVVLVDPLARHLPYANHNTYQKPILINLEGFHWRRDAGKCSDLELCDFQFADYNPCL